jgi:MATE family multidrug resistance protein
MPTTSAALRALLTLALPMVIARATQSVMTFADALFVQHLGTGAIAASATGGLNVFLVAILPMGIVFIVQSFVSQLVGRGDLDDTPRFAWYGLGVAAVTGVLAIAAIPLIEPALALTSFSPGVQAQMGDYMTIRMFGIGAIVAVEALGNWYGGLGNTWMALVASVVSMVVDLFLNWVLVFGKLGAPELGVDGAALSSAIGSWVGVAVLGIAFWRRWGGAPAGRRPRGLSLRELGRVIRFGPPNGFNWLLEFSAFQLFVTVVFGKLGDESVAALNVVIAINSVSFMPAFGLASAGAILAGQAIGRGARHEVWPQVKLTLLVAMTWMGAVGLVYVLAPVPLMTLFDQAGKSELLVTTGASMLVISAAWQLFDAVGITLSETLRSAGDTFWTASARFVLAWAVFLPSSYLVVEVLGFGPLAATGCLVGYLALLAGAFAYRFRSEAWKRIELIEPKLV